MGESNKSGEEKLPPNYYFNNHEVEQLIMKYQSTGCTSIQLRDKIMSHAHDLIINVIRTHSLHTIYSGKDESSFNDLFQIAWQQIESTLYKFNSGPGHSKIFNMWSQIARTVILAAIKKDNRDKKNADNYKLHLDGKVIKRDIQFDRFIKEAKELFQYCDEHTHILSSLEELYYEDEKPHEGLISKLSDKSKLSRIRIVRFMKILRVLAGELTDSPILDLSESIEVVKPSTIICHKEEE